MRIGVGIGCLVFLVASAAAAPPGRKHATATYPADALKSFAFAFAKELEGDYEEAISAYESSRGASPQPSTACNLGRLYLELGDPAKARARFDEYLTLLPTAPDAPAVKKLIAELATVTTVTIGSGATGELVDAIVLLDGEVVGSSPAVTHPTPGRHLFQRLTATGYGSEWFDVKAGDASFENVYTRGPGKGGHVVLSTPATEHPWSWTEGGHPMRVHELFALPVGHYTTSMPISAAPKLCTPIEFDVKATTEITYVHVELGAKQDACVAVKKVHLHRLPLRAP
jgi:tetratricopeptide (TPR) repeat protein